MAAATDQDKEHASSITITYLIQVTQAYINIAQDMITQARHYSTPSYWRDDCQGLLVYMKSLISNGTTHFKPN